MLNKYLIIITVLLFSSYLQALPHGYLTVDVNNYINGKAAGDYSSDVSPSADVAETGTELTETKGDSQSNSSVDDSSNTDPDSTTSWSYHALVSVQNKAIKKGEVTANGKALMQLETGLSYEKLAFTVGFGKEAFANVWTDFILGLNYTFNLAKWLDLSLGASQFRYIHDTLNIFSENSNSLQSNLIFKLWDFSFDVSYLHLFGTSPVNYISFTLNYTKAVGDFELGLTADVTSSDFTKKAKKNLDRFKRITNSKSMIYTGIFSLSYSLPYNLNIGASGGLTQDFKGKVQPIFNIELGYYLDF